MATTVREFDQITAAVSPASLEVEGTLPAGLAGSFVQASPHPAGGDGRRPILTGLRLGGGQASIYREPGARPFGPAPALTDALPGVEARSARPVKEAATGVWHTVVTYPGTDRAEHVVMAEDGTVLDTAQFALPGGPLVETVAITERYLIVLDLPVAYHRAKALLGADVSYAWQEDRPARIWLLPVRPDGTAPRWFAIDPCWVSQIVHAYEDGDRVVLDAVRHERPGRPGHVCSWEVHPAARRVRGRRLTGPVDLATVDGRVSGRQRYVYGVAVDELGPVMLTRYDLTTWRTVERPLGIGVLAGQPVFVPRKGVGQGWLLVLVEDPVHRCAALIVLDAMDIAGPPVAVVEVPIAMSAGWQTTWVGR